MSFFVPGQPRPQGSKRWLPNGAMKEAGEKNLRPWRSAVTYEAQAEMRKVGLSKIEGPVFVIVDFHFSRPKSHFGTGRNAGVLKTAAPFFYRSQPDIDKLERAVLDAMTDAGVWSDDAQVATLHATKVYADLPGARIEVGRVGG